MNWDQWLKQNPDRILNEFGRDPNAPAQRQIAAALAAPVVTPVTPTEHDEQVAVFQWATANEYRLPALHWLFAIPNGALRHPVVARQLKSSGVKAGVPDIFLPVPAHGKAGLWIELKRSDRSNHISADQNEWIAALSSFNFDCAVCYGAIEAIETLEDYLS